MSTAAFGVTDKDAPVAPLTIERRAPGPRGIRVNAISAGAVKTLSLGGIQGGRSMLSEGRRWAPMRRDTEVEGVAGAALYLLSDLGRSCTGEVLHVDAGFHIVGMPDEDQGDEA